MIAGGSQVALPQSPSAPQPGLLFVCVSKTEIKTESEKWRGRGRDHHLAVEVFVCAVLHQHAAPRPQHQLLLLLALLARLGGPLGLAGLQVLDG